MTPVRQLKPSVRSAERRGGFTLLEIMLAVAILMIITVVVAQFTELTVQSAEVSARNTEEGLACNGLRHLLAAEFASVPANQDDALIGMNITNHGARRDALQMICPAGNAVLTPDAKGYYQITLVLREVPRGSGKMVLGLERQPWIDDDDDDDDDDDSSTTAAKGKSLNLSAVVEKLPADWIPLLPGVQQIEIAYFDARLNSWLNRWTDSAMLPSLVRVRLTFAPGQSPYEIVEHVPNGGLKRVQAAVALPAANSGATGTTAPNSQNAPGGSGSSAISR
jgi:hypothetical protein